MTDVREETQELLADRPSLDSSLQALLSTDEEGTWDFQEIDLDSGVFGELVDRGIVESNDDGYRIADRDGVRAALNGNHPPETEPKEASRFDIRDVSIKWRLVASICGVLLVAVLMRTVFTYGSVFREGNIVLLSNDPYFHRYWIEQILDTKGGISLSGLSSLPGGLAVHDVLSFVVLWGFATLLGGTPHATGLTLAWYPVLFGLISVYLAYSVARQLSMDRRVGLASAAMLAITPVHAYRTALGFGDHHALDMLLVTLGLWSVVALAGKRNRIDYGTYMAACVLGIATSGLALAWRGGPIFLVPVGVVATTWAFTALYHGRSARELVPFCAGLGLAAVVTIAAHEWLGWVEGYRAFAPGMLFGGVLCVIGATVVANRHDLGVLGGVVGSGLLLSSSALAAWNIVPDVQRAVGQAQLYFSQTGDSAIAETQSLFSTDLGGIFAPALFFGLVFFLGIGYLVWATWYSVREYRPGWTAVATFAWCYILLAIVQSRFAGPLAVFIAVFAGLGFIHIASRIDITDRPLPMTDTTALRSRDLASDISLPSRDSVKYFVVLFLLVGSLSAVQTPVKSSQLTIDDATYEAAIAANESAAERNLSYPENYVLSEWGRNRVYNYFVNGQSRYYGYAREVYSSFLRDTVPSNWTSQLQSRPVGFVVTEDRSGFGPQTMQTRLHEQYGSRDGDVSGLGHYRLVYASPDGSTKVFALVRGATITASGAPGERVTVSTDISISGTSFEYRREPTIAENGTARITVPYTGAYQVGNRTVRVTEAELDK